VHRAEYVPPRTLRADEWSWEDDVEFDVDDDGEEWIPEDWYERAHTPDVSYPIQETITHWMRIPEVPK
jgi:hypothetical protein